jgi:hypothetical protein
MDEKTCRGFFNLRLLSIGGLTFLFSFSELGILFYVFANFNSPKKFSAMLFLTPEVFSILYLTWPTAVFDFILKLCTYRIDQ